MRTLGLILVALLLASCAPVSDGTADKPAGSSVAEPKESPYEPVVTDFVIDVRVKAEECYGDAGCNVTVGLNPNYTGNPNIGDKSWDVTYELVGGEDGATTDTMTLEGDQISFTDEAFLQTRKRGAKITARVTRVDPGY